MGPKILKFPSKILFLLIASVFLIEIKSIEVLNRRKRCATVEFPDVEKTCTQCKECVAQRLMSLQYEKRTPPLELFIENTQQMCAVQYGEANESDAITCAIMMMRYVRALAKELATAAEASFEEECKRYSTCYCKDGADATKYIHMSGSFLHVIPDNKLVSQLPNDLPAFVAPLVDKANSAESLKCSDCYKIAADMKKSFSTYKKHKYWFTPIVNFCSNLFSDSQNSNYTCILLFDTSVHGSQFLDKIGADLENAETFCSTELMCSGDGLAPDTSKEDSQSGGDGDRGHVGGSDKQAEQKAGVHNLQPKIFFIFLFVLWSASKGKFSELYIDN